MVTALAPAAPVHRTLLAVDERLELSDTKTVRSFPFTVPEGTTALELRMDWSPRFCRDQEYNRAAVRGAVAEWIRPQGAAVPDDEDLPEEVRRFFDKIAQLLNVVLVAPDGRWRGRTDRGRGSREPLVLREDAVPLGFIPGPLTPGEWSAELEAHFVGQSGCDVTLSITAIADSPSSIPRPAPVAEIAPVERRAGGPGWYRGELHSHSEHSDGAYPVAKLLRRAEELGLDFLTLTDHNTLAGRQELEQSSMPTILGVELTTFYGHHVVLGAQETVPWHRGGEVRDVHDVMGEYKAQGALFTLTHPFCMGDPVCTGCRWITPDLDLSQVDLLEIWHRYWSGAFEDNLSAYALWDDLWRQGSRPVAIGVRDWHGRSHEAPLPGPLPTTVIQSRSLEADDLLDGLRQGRAYVSSGPTVDVALVDAHGGRHGIGDVAAATPGPVKVQVSVDGFPRGEDARLRLLRCGEEVDSQPVTGDGQLELLCPTGGDGWYRVEIWSGEQPLVITNHIELTA